jgi:N-acetylmuramoyl-L-alanine amidase
MRPVNQIIIHCSATPAGREHTAADIDRWHRQHGFSRIGYHYVIRLDGTVEVGRPLEEAGAHASQHNAFSIGICYIGGLNRETWQPEDTRTTAQRCAMAALVRVLKQFFPRAEVLGHRDLPNVAKACPCFDAIKWWASVDT